MKVYYIAISLKAIGMGFVFGDGTYLKDCWNVIDFIVVMTSFLSLIGSSTKISAIRTIRILRPLRSINAIKGIIVIF